MHDDARDGTVKDDKTEAQFNTIEDEEARLDMMHKAEAIRHRVDRMGAPAGGEGPPPPLLDGGAPSASPGRRKARGPPAHPRSAA